MQTLSSISRVARPDRTHHLISWEMRTTRVGPYLSRSHLPHHGQTLTGMETLWARNGTTMLVLIQGVEVELPDWIAEPLLDAHRAQPVISSTPTLRGREPDMESKPPRSRKQSSAKENRHPLSQLRTPRWHLQLGRNRSSSLRIPPLFSRHPLSSYKVRRRDNEKANRSDHSF